MNASPKALILLLCWIALGACENPAEKCFDAAKVRIASPSGWRIATVYPGGCPFLAPQVTVDFGRGGGGVFAVRDSAARIEARWISEDTLQVSYPAGVTVEKREGTIQHFEQRVHVVYRERAAE